MTATAAMSPARITRDTVQADVVIVGAGFSGLAAAARLRPYGKVIVLERAADVGGVWRDNTYPGVACDTPSHLYSLSVQPNPEWTRTYSGGAEIGAYLRDLADRQGLRPLIRFGQDVRSAAWDAAARRWVVETPELRIEASVLVDCAGPLTEAVVPALDGLESFPGPVFHSSAWPHDVDLRDKRVAVVGTGASAIQFIPEIQPKAARLVVFQRTPAWVIPKPDRATFAFERAVLRRLPVLARAAYWLQWIVRDGTHHPVIRRARWARRAGQALSRAYLRATVRDADLRRRLTPDYEIGCKRILFSNGYYQALSQPNVRLVAAGASAVRGSSIVGEDGSRHEVDAIVFGTGFDVAAPPIVKRLFGRDGRSLEEVWAGGHDTYKATQISGFPNLFRICGPGTGLGTGAMTCQIESQLSYVEQALQAMRIHGLAELDIRPEAQDRYMDDVGRRLDATVWARGGCSSWYLDGHRRPTVMWPGTMWRFRRVLATFSLAAHLVEPLAPAGADAEPSSEPVLTTVV